MVDADVAQFIGLPSNYLDMASTVTKNILFIKGPAKSMCRRAHGLLGHTQRCNGAFARFRRLACQDLATINNSLQALLFS